MPTSSHSKLLPEIPRAHSKTCHHGTIGRYHDADAETPQISDLECNASSGMWTLIRYFTPGMPNSTELERKILFFNSVESIRDADRNNNDNDDEQHGVLPPMQNVFKPFKSTQPLELDSSKCLSSARVLEPIDDNQRNVQKPLHTQTISERRRENKPVSLISKSAVRETSRLSSPTTMSPQKAPPASKISPTSRKSKAATASGASCLVPQQKRIFDGLRFYFIPPNDICKARKFRIKKATEYSAQWVRQWSQELDYIIVDRHLTLKDVLEFLKLANLPTDVVAVNEMWPADCIADGNLLDPSLACYRLKGAPPTANMIKPPPQQKDSEASLQLKPAKTSNFGYESETPASIEHTPEGDYHCDSSASQYQSFLSNGKSGSSNVSTQISKEEHDPLAEIFGQIKANSHLPLSFDDDYDDDDGDDSTSFQDPQEDLADISDSEKSPSPQVKRKRKFVQSARSDWQSKFQCMQPHRSGEAKINPNDYTISILQQMMSYYVSVQDHWRARAYRQGIAALKKQHKEIRSKEEAQSIPFIGEKLAMKIEEISRTSKLRQLENTRLDPCDKALKLFLGIYGVGFTQAAIWAQHGYRSIQDLLEAGVNLTKSQKIGIEHYADFAMRIPRKEVEQLGAIVTNALLEIDPRFQATIGGSYRRGSADSGDIDLIITKPDSSLSELRTLVLESLVPVLQRSGFLVAALAATTKGTGSKWNGACQLPLEPQNSITGGPNPKAKIPNHNPWRRIDLLLVPPDEIGAALLYFTGNDIFNRSMRLLARRKGFRLNQKGLYKNVLRHGSKRVTDGTKVAGENERDIFKILGVPWREAWERVI